MTTGATAFLGCVPDYTIFRFGDVRLKFRAPYSLESYEHVKEWDSGYLVVDAKYSHSDKPVEDYIDLVPILSDLCFDPDEFLKPIREVKVMRDAS